MKGLLGLISVLLLPLLAGAQTYYPVKHGQGTQVVGVNPVTVIPQNAPGVQLPLPDAPGYVCNNTIGPYSLGENGKKQSFRFQFGYPVKGLMLYVGYVGEGDTLAFSINDNFFPVNSSHIATNLANNFCTGYTILCETHNGLLGPGISQGAPFNYSKAPIIINPASPISNFTISYVGDKTGMNFSLWYAIDPHVYVKEPFTDTIICAGDSLQIGAKVSDSFNKGNAFKVQLSDANGDFTNGTIIGTRFTDTAGNILCGIPRSLPEGGTYRFRIISTLPADTSASNTLPIRIAHYPDINLSSNSPVCEGEVLRLDAVTSNAKQKWSGPGGFSATVANPSFISEMKFRGKYEVTTDNFGCFTTAATTVVVKPVPLITSVNNTSPKCENEEIVLQAKTSDTLATFSWTGPENFSANVPSPRLSDVRLNSAGVYSVVATLDGCISLADTTNVTIYPRPERPVITVNNPVRPSDSLVFRAAGGTDATYQWTGPGGFNTTEQNPIKTLVDVSDEGEYTVTATMGTCTSSSSVVIDVLQAALDYYLVPNPSNGNIRIYGNYGVNNKAIPFEIVTATGQVVHTGQIATEKKFLDIKLDMGGQLSHGVYFIRLQVKDEMLKIPFVIGQ